MGVNNMKTLITISSALLMLSSFSQAYAAGNIQLKTVAEVETTVTDDKGNKAVSYTHLRSHETRSFI